MLDKKIRILNFDGSIARQKRLLSRYESELIDLTDVGPRARFLMNRADRLRVERRIPENPSRSVTFLGSGDFHHITDILISRHEEPISVIDFDFHPDWDTAFPFLHCGSWVTRAMRRRNVLKCIIFGASSLGSTLFSLQTGDLDSLKNDRIEIYPYSRKSSTVFFRAVPPNISFEVKKYPLITEIFWNELKNKNITEFFLHTIRRLPTKKVYVTVDKDCLGAGDALTNWDQGTLPLEDLLIMLKMIKENLDIVGMDIAGDYSPIRTGGIFRKLISHLGHPGETASDGVPAFSIDEVNERTNLRILDLVTS